MSLLEQVQRNDPSLIPVRVELLDGSSMWRGLPDLEHGTLCRAFGLDACSTWFDLPSTARGTGSSSVGGGASRRNGTVSGFIFQGPKGSDPIGKLTIAFASERFRDVDPSDRREFFKL